MNGYSEIGKIYFNIGERTAFAAWLSADHTHITHQEAKTQIKKLPIHKTPIIVGHYQGLPPYKHIKGNIPDELKGYHAAEHQVYNCFKNKIQGLPLDSSLQELRKHIPELAEVRKTSNFSVFCGTTIYLLSGISLIVAALPNIFKFHNTEPLFMLPWFASSIALALAVSFWVQKTFFLSPASDKQILLAIEALKEVTNNGTNS